MQSWPRDVMRWARAEVPRVCDALADEGPARIGEELHRRFDAWLRLHGPRMGVAAPVAKMASEEREDPTEPGVKHPTKPKTRGRRKRSE